jgi:hypothetical protein
VHASDGVARASIHLHLSAAARRLPLAHRRSEDRRLAIAIRLAIVLVMFVGGAVGAQAGIDPSNPMAGAQAATAAPPPPPPPTGGALRGAARGALIGNALDEDASNFAVAGAIAGGARTARRGAQQQAQAQSQANSQNQATANSGRRPSRTRSRPAWKAASTRSSSARVRRAASPGPAHAYARLSGDAVGSSSWNTVSVDRGAILRFRLRTSIGTKADGSR